ncbi:MAG: T9SS type A sorting domain-containing protein [Bacteroidetes bacterium]|nr:T9SS type A sorting domain-containing protein [Bacteroidota bacterium]
MFKKLLLLSGFTIGCQIANAQPTIQFERNFGGTNNEQINCMLQTSDGGYLLVGTTNSTNGDVLNPISGDDVWIVKTNLNGTITWRKTFGGTGDDRAFAAQQTSDGGYIVTGTSNSTSGDVINNRGGFDIFLLKINASGIKTWWKNIGGSDDDEARSVWQHSDGGYILAGGTKSDDQQLNNNKGGYDFLVARVNSAGNLRWCRNYGGSSDEIASGLQQTSAGDIIVAGSTTSNDNNVSNNKGGSDYWVVRLKGNGDIKWAKTFGGTDYDEAASIQQTSTGNFVIAGTAISNNGDVPGNKGGADFWVIRINGVGGIVWSRNYGGGTADDARSIRQTPDGGFLIAGETESASNQVPNNSGGDDFLIVKISSNGAFQWAETSGGSDDDRAYSIVTTNDGGFAVAGASQSDDGNVASNNGNNDFWFVKYNSSASRFGIDATESIVKIYPNPVFDQLFINSVDQIEIIRIYNSMGQLQLTNTIGNTNGVMNLSNLSSGLYILESINDQGIGTRQSFIKQ